MLIQKNAVLLVVVLVLTGLSCQRLEQSCKSSWEQLLEKRKSSKGNHQLMVFRGRWIISRTTSTPDDVNPGRRESRTTSTTDFERQPRTSNVNVG